jgi:hypothetical protein
MKQKTKLLHLSVIALAFVFGLTSLVAVAKSENGNGGGKDKSNKSSQSEGKSKKKEVNLKNYQKPDAAKGETHAQINKEKTQEVVQNLEQVATQEESAGNTQISVPVENVVAEQTQTQEETVEAIGKVESRGQVAKFILGPDYKNLGQLRSSLAHYENDIRKLTKALNLTAGTGNIVSGTGNIVSGTGTQSTIEAQLVNLYRERERVRGLVYEHQDFFSLFGWFSKIMNGYTPLPVTDPVGDSLTNQVEDAIDNTTTDNTGIGTTNSIDTNTAPTVSPTPTVPPAPAAPIL